MRSFKSFQVHLQGQEAHGNLDLSSDQNLTLKFPETLVGMVEVGSTIIPKRQADIKQTATKKKNPGSGFQCQMQQHPWHWAIPPPLRGENPLGAPRTSSRQNLRRQQLPGGHQRHR